MEAIQKTKIANESLVKFKGTFKLILLYAATLGLLYAGFWLGYYCLTGWWGIGAAVLLVAVSSIFLAVFRKKMWSALVSCLSVSAGIGLSVSTFFVVLGVEPSRFFGLVLIIVLLYKSLQSILMTKFRRKMLITALFIVGEIIATIVFFALMQRDMGLYSQIGFSCTIAVFLSFGQLALYKCGANDMWRTVALSYIIGFAFIVLLVVLLIISILAEDGSPLEILAHLSFGDVGSPTIKGSKNKKTFL